MKITGILLASVLTLGSCNTKTNNEYISQGFRYRDSVWAKSSDTFWKNQHEDDIKPKKFYTKWKNLNDSLNRVMTPEQLKKSLQDTSKFFPRWI